MLKAEELRENILRSIKKNITNKEFINYVAEKVNEEFDFPYSSAIDLLTLRSNFEEYGENTLYYFAKVLSEYTTNNKFKESNKFKNFKNYFTKLEVETYSKKYLCDSKDFPMNIEAIQICEDQWIGKITVKQLMNLRDAQMIKYNENAQRTMRRITVGEDVIYKIALNKRAVNEIKKSFISGEYISNTLTLNVRKELGTRVKYKNGCIIINKDDDFDILDGYHRYIAISDIYNSDRNFDYPMELRITNFSDEIAKQFIWQEDQKTKMKKIDSDSFNTNSYPNKIIGMLNKDDYLLRGFFNANGIIDSGISSRMIGLTFFRGMKFANNKYVYDVRDTIQSSFDSIIHNAPELFDKTWTPDFIVSVFYCIWKVNDLDKLLDSIYKLQEAINKEEYLYIIKRINFFTATDISRLDKIFEKEV